MFGLENEVHGSALKVSAAFSLVMDNRYLWFLASHCSPARLHPRGRPGAFQTELWRYDVAELFLADASGVRYFEFNLAPNGAWWSCEFTAPRVRAEEVEIAMPEVATFSEMSADGAWLAAMALPLDLLRARLDFGPETRMNVSMILETPSPKFISAANLGTGEPDFHQPALFPKVNFAPLQPHQSIPADVGSLLGPVTNPW